jgi:hypothetical protein
MSPISVGILPPVEFPPEDVSITGLRLSLLMGRQRDVYGLDFGVVGNITQQTFVGTAVSGLFNINRGMTIIVGAQIAGLTNMSKQKTRVYGLQLSAIATSLEAESSVTGLQFALVNLASHTRIYGLQVGAYNVADAVYGFQIGVVNVCNNLHGLQIGLVNFHRNGVFSVAPILNFGS